MERLALLGGRPVRQRPFPGWPVHNSRERELLLEVLEDGEWSFDGPRESRFTDRFAAFCQTAAAFAVTSGTVALEVGLRALGVGPGDEVADAEAKPPVLVPELVR
jgi:dTDP-4-amino-4,6-dideoxygalactose transaminase